MQDFKNSNPILRQSISTYSKNKTQKNRNRVYESISKGPLLVVVDTVPESFLLKQLSNEEYSLDIFGNNNYLSLSANMLAV